MSMATDHQERRFPNAVRYLRDEIEPLYGNDFHYDPIQLASFLDRNNGTASFSRDITARANSDGHVLEDGPKDHYSQQYGEAFSKDNSRSRGIGRRVGNKLSSYGSGRLGKALAVAGAALGGAYTLFVNYDIPDPSMCFLNDCGPNQYLGDIQNFLYHVKDVAAGGVIGYVGGRILGAVTGRMFRRNRSQQSP